jgi:ubiquinone/menaquinone biosynthesis C-methylase UbiE
MIIHKIHNDIAQLHPTTRFSNRVENYVKYRPSYPEEIISFLEETIGLDKCKRVVDIGSGTGIFSELFLKRGYGVTGIEPNENMRKAAENKLAKYARFKSRNHQAEQTGLRSHSVDLITVAQAFHWMQPEQTKKEFLRILKPEGHIVLAWNLRLKDTAFLQAYEALKQKYGIDYLAAKMVNEASIQEFYAPKSIVTHSFSNIQLLDFESLKGHLLSASYIPLPGHSSYDSMIGELANLFVTHNDHGLIGMEYETKVYVNKESQ